MPVLPSAHSPHPAPRCSRMRERTAISSATGLTPTLSLNRVMPSRAREAASARSSSSVGLANRCITATCPRNAPPSSVATGTPRCCPTRSCTAASQAARAPVSAGAASAIRRSSARRRSASDPASTGPMRSRTAATMPPSVSPVIVGAADASPQPVLPSCAMIRTSRDSDRSMRWPPPMSTGRASGSEIAIASTRAILSAG